MHRLALLLLGLAACPPPSRYMIADVTIDRLPLQGALVAAECGTTTAARKTDEDGRARITLRGEVDAGKCVVTAAAPELPPVERHGANVCTGPYACPPMAFELGGAR